MSKRIQGITIEIDGNTSKLNDALKNTNKVISQTNSEIKALNSALKLDPKNTELLAQKQELLKKSIQETTTKLNTLKEAQKQMGDYNKLTDEQKSNYRALSVEIAKTESALKEMNSEANKTSKIDMSRLKDSLSKVASVAGEVAKKMAQATAAIGTALGALVVKGVKSYASLEQNIGGINKLFGESANEVIENAKKAYKTAGLSANQYMETATSFSASLLRGLSGNTKEAARLTDIAIRDMSDNANTFGTSMDEVMNVYKALSKEMYTTLDNLRLGYAGTKTGMKELIADSAKYTVIQEKLGLTVDATSMSFDNVIKAISVMQEYLKIMGTTEKEAMETITGSLNMTKAALDNFLNGIGSPEQLVESLKAFINNVSKAVQKLAPSLLTGIVDIFKQIVPEVLKTLTKAIPQLLDAISGLIDSILEMITSDSDKFDKTITKLIKSIIKFISTNIPKITQIVYELILKIVDVLVKQIPTFMDTIANLINTLTLQLNSYLPLFIEAALKIIMALAQGLTKAIPTLLKAVPEVVSSLVVELLKPEFQAMLLVTGIQLVLELTKGLIKAIPEMLLSVPKIIIEIAKGLTRAIADTNWKQLGKNILNGVVNGFMDFHTTIKNAVKSFGNAVMKEIKNFFKIKSPSRLMRDEIGEQLTAGIGVGFEQGVPDMLRDVDNAMVDLNNGIKASVNPVINPTANSNPLYLTIDKFYNNRDTDIQQLAQELEFYRKNAALAKGGN